MNAVASSSVASRAFRFSLLSLALLALLLVAGWVFFSEVVQWSAPWNDWQSAIEVDGETIHISGGDPLHWLMAGLGLVITFVVVVLVVPVVVLLALAVPMLLVVALLAVPLLIAAVVLSPILLILWLLWKLIA